MAASKGIKSTLLKVRFEFFTVVVKISNGGFASLASLEVQTIIYFDVETAIRCCKGSRIARRDVSVNFELIKLALSCLLHFRNDFTEELFLILNQKNFKSSTFCDRNVL